MGYEATVRTEVMRRREARLAAMVEADGMAYTSGAAPRRPLHERSVERWLERTVSRAGERLAAVRDRLFAVAPLRRDDLVLDLAAGTGLLTWEAAARPRWPGVGARGDGEGRGRARAGPRPRC